MLTGDVFVNSRPTFPQRTGDTKPNFFQDCLMEIFDNLEQHIQNPLVLQSILGLMERGTMVLTTNYDNLLEIFGQQQNKPMESLDLKDKTKVRAAGPGGGRRVAGEGSKCLHRWVGAEEVFVSTAGGRSAGKALSTLHETAPTWP